MTLVLKGNLAEDPHLNPPHQRGSERMLTFTVNSETRQRMQYRNPGPQFLPPPTGEG